MLLPVWSRRFETPLVLRPPERSGLGKVALVVWAPATLLLAAARIPWPATCVLAGWLIMSIVREIRDWNRRPCRMVWRPRTGWVLEWRDGRRHQARLTEGSRVYRNWMALEWSVAGRARVRLALSAGRNGRATQRRLRVLLRNGRAAG